MNSQSNSTPAATTNPKGKKQSRKLAPLADPGWTKAIDEPEHHGEASTIDLGPTSSKGPSLTTFSERLIAWGREHGRHDLPWTSSDPYKVWISEIMLQQTQTQAAKGHFARFMGALPTLRDLAQASEQDVLTLWSGLGYYSRARNIWKSGQIIATQWNGCMPKTAKELETLPGIGRSTAAAIAAFCFEEASPILDGNVQRGLTRLWGLEAPIDTGAGRRVLWALAEQLMPQQQTAAYTQAIMDFGATLCKPKTPDCSRCPFEQECVARIQGEISRFPNKSKSKSPRPTREEYWAGVRWGSQVLLVKNEQEKGVWRGLFILPSATRTQDALRESGCAAWAEELSDPQAWSGMQVQEVEHEFSHYALRARLKWIVPELESTQAQELAHRLGGQWVPLAQGEKWPLPSPVARALLQQIGSEEGRSHSSEK